MGPSVVRHTAPDFSKDLVPQRFLHKVQHGLVGLRLLLRVGLLLLALGEGVGGSGVLEGLVHILHKGLGHELIHLVGEVQDLISLVQQPLSLRHGLGHLHILGAEVEDARLAFLHPLHVLAQGFGCRAKPFQNFKYFSRSSFWIFSSWAFTFFSMLDSIR